MTNTTTDVKNRVACLYRVSTTKQVDHDDQNQADIPMQRKACREYAEKMGWHIVIEEQENGVSGFKVSANDRDKIQLLKEYAEQDKFDILLVFMFDRIGRRAEETPFVVEWFVKHGIQIWSVNEGEQRIDSHADRLMNYIRFWQADGESQKTSIRTKTALGQMVQEGRFRGGVAPYGYRLVLSGILNKRKHEVYKLEVNEDEARVVCMMFDMSVERGYGRVKIAGVLTKMGIKNRDGRHWHEATIGHILHNVLYTGVLRSGKARSEVIPELQIVSAETFQLAQKLMTERTNEYNAQRTMPKNTSGQSLLSGNVFCGHCGGRLTLTTNGTVRTNAAGEVIKRRRFRYVCYNKTRKRRACDGQTGYTMHLLDALITKVLHMIFDKMRGVDEKELIARIDRNATVSLEERIAATRIECEQAATEYDTLKTEVVKAVRGSSAFPVVVLSELVNTARQKMLDANALLSRLLADVEHEKDRVNRIRAEYNQLMEWAEVFDTSPIEVKKMIAGYIIKRVEVFAGYRLNIVLNTSVAQFELGLDFPEMISAESMVS